MERSPSGGFRFESDPVVDRIAESLFAAEISLRRLDRYMPEKKLNLFEFAACLMAKVGAGSAHVVGRNRTEPAIRSCWPNNGPDDFGSESAAPYLASLFTERNKTLVCRFAEVRYH